MKEYTVYMLRCRDKSYYTGVTNNLELRLCEHQEGVDPKCYTYSKRPVKLAWNYSFDDIRDAIAAEKQIKGWSRKKKEALIEGQLDLLPELSKSGYAKRIDKRKKEVKENIHATLRG